ncbi:MAG: hypothetical protein M4579_005159 [Chaenotheca gracillima]|nr:MAG: hypothetical protein M4579_005159 [Chaenotheca gracillima]
MSTEFISFLSAPGSAIVGYDHSKPSSEQSSTIPATFVEAMSVRETVFVQEQGVPLDNEFDVDDARSFHWVVYASVAANTVPSADSAGRKGSASETTRIPVGTIRLVPPPHPPHPDSGSHHSIDNAEAATPVSNTGAQDFHSKWHDGKESYVKLGRLATLPAYRGLGLGRLLVNAALEWARNNPGKVIPLKSAASREAAKVEGGLGEGDERWKGLVLVHAQTSVERMWAKYNFERDDQMGVWDEEGIDHIGMWRRITVKAEEQIIR